MSTLDCFNPGDDKWHDECGVFGILGHDDAATVTFYGLYALQHRGQESCGIATSDGKNLITFKGMGLVARVFDEVKLAALKGHIAIGHVRYSTSGASYQRNCQPFTVDYAHGSLSVAHNGNFTNGQLVKQELEAEGSIFQSSSDTEVVVHLIARSKAVTTPKAVVEALTRLEGAYSLVIMSNQTLIGVRDPRGFRPLSIGKLGNSYILASETSAIDLLQAEIVRDVEPGEMVVIDKDGIHSSYPFEPKQQSLCVFEYIYFARPDSVVYGHNVHQVRKAFGRRLALEHPVEADLVIPVPDSGISAALGYAEESKIPFDFGIIRNHYVGRTFIQPMQMTRELGVTLKLNPVTELIEGKRVILVDDSLVRGTTSRKVIQLLRSKGAKEVHFRISCPPTRHPCFFGIDTPYKDQLIAATHSLEEICEYLNADSLGYLSIKGILTAAKIKKEHYCLSCFDGKYPVDINQATDNLEAAQKQVRAIQLEF